MRQQTASGVLLCFARGACVGVAAGFNWCGKNSGTSVEVRDEMRVWEKPVIWFYGARREAHVKREGDGERGACQRELSGGGIADAEVSAI